MKSLISIHDLSKEEILHILEHAKKLKNHPPKPSLSGKILATCFFEPSTRTRLSFESAMLRLGGNVIGFSDSTSTSVKKGESLSDTIRIIEGYCDLIVLRHPKEGAARLAQDLSSKPIINAGDGAHQHPSQTLLDLFTIQECQNKLDGIRIAFTGDLKHGRTVHSLALACALFNMRLYFLSPPSLSMPDEILFELKRKGVKFSFHKTLEEILDKIDILYMTRLQKERLTAPETEKALFSLSPEMLQAAPAHLKILHPLPRQEELPASVDALPFAHYFPQAQNGLFVRQALLLELA
jgi:aspartate carbamoyltransferase catalytic subunit